VRPKEAKGGFRLGCPSSSLCMSNRVAVSFALEQVTAEVRPPNHALERTAPVASRRVPPLNYVRWAASPNVGVRCVLLSSVEGPKRNAEAS
jgi:hypothetical protein